MRRLIKYVYVGNTLQDIEECLRTNRFMVLILEGNSVKVANVRLKFVMRSF